MMASMTTTKDIVLKLTPGMGSGTIDLRVTPDYEAEVVALLDEHDIDNSSAIELSANSDLAIVAVPLAATVIAPLAKVLWIFFQRHHDKEISVSVGDRGVSMSAKGYSMNDVEKLLDKASEEQAEHDRQWQQWKLEHGSDTD